MATKVYKLVLTFAKVEEKHLPRLVVAVNKGGRRLHADAVLIVGDTPPPEILMYGEDLTPDEQLTENP